MRKLAKILPKVAMYVLMAVSIVAGVLFYTGGNIGTLDVAGDMLPIPRYTDLFMNWAFILFCIIVVVTLCAVIASFGTQLRHNPLKALKGLVPVIVFALVFVVAWFMGSPEEMKIIGYEGTENVGVWAQASDMMLYSTYILVGCVLATIAICAVYTRLKK